MSDHQRAKAVRLRELGWTYSDIAEKLDVSSSTVYRWLNPEKAAAMERKRRKAKNRWHHQNYHGTCRICGGETGQRTTDRCRECSLKAIHERHDARLAIIERMYNDGAPLKEIQAAVGYKTGMLGREMAELRAQGRIGYRRPAEHVRKVREGRWGKAA